jgi:hypothetical protein
MNVDVIIIGAGAAGLMCAIEADRRGRSVLVLDHNAKAGEKIRVSGGGMCNVTNVDTGPANYISNNPHFCKSALSRFSPADMMKLMDKHHIRYHEKKLGQLFCDDGSEKILAMLLGECKGEFVTIHTGCRVHSVHTDGRFTITTNKGVHISESLVVATGGLSMPKMGATNFGYTIAEQFGIDIVEPRPGLVPLIFNSNDCASYRNLSGVSLEAEVSLGKIAFRASLLFTHRGLSGPAILQISSYWHPGTPITINALPHIDVLEVLTKARTSKKELATVLGNSLPSRFIVAWLEDHGGSRPINRYSTTELENLTYDLTHWQITPEETEGYNKAEVTVGGVDTAELSSKTMQVKKVAGLFFVGEVVDVTGWLGGYNLQWAWSSGWAAGQVC